MTTGTRARVDKLLTDLGVSATRTAVAAGSRWLAGTGGSWQARSPIDGAALAEFPLASARDLPPVIAVATESFAQWREVPAPQRGALVRAIGEELRAHQDALAALVSYEAGKIVEEGRGEVQEMIDVCEFAVGLSRQLYGLTIASERREHRLSEQWHPLGPVGVITAFNFPVAVWAWNAMIAVVCGDSVVWKPSHQAPLCAIAVTKIAHRVLERNGAPPIFTLLMGGRTGVGERLVADPRIPLISATGSTRMGREVGKVLADRFGRGLL